MGDRGSAARLNLVEMAEHVEASAAASVVQLTLRQHAQQRRLASVSAPHHCYPDLDVVLIVWHLRTRRNQKL